MDNRAEIREFLVTRRAKVSPEQVGLPAGGGKRRVPGLRREEVAVLAGVSTEWYVRLEKGYIGGVSVDVLEAVCRALRLDDAERLHLFNLARAARPSRAVRRRTASTVRPSVLRMLDAMVGAPAHVRNGRLDVLAMNSLGVALHAPVFESPTRPVNLARFVFLDQRANDYYADWDDVASSTVAILRTEAGRDPYDRQLTELVGELATRSDEFRKLWGSHDVVLHLTGTKRLHHPVVGYLELAFDAMELPGDQGLTITVYTAEKGSPSDDGLKMLSSWAATAEVGALNPTSTSPRIERTSHT